jgi:8-oxo-dGTP pyrophosphatase MutT (NUDIX family)
MPQKYVVYLNEKAIFFNNPQGLQDQPVDIIPLSGRTENTVLNAVFFVDNSKNDKIAVLLNEINLEQGIDLLKTHLKFLTAAGGIVVNQQNQHLFIHRLGKWDLPKGKAAKNETPMLTASREIEEETGIHVNADGHFLCHTYHIYKLKRTSILKKTWWYKFETEDTSIPLPQTEEAITQAAWLNLEEAGDAASQSYPSIKDVWNCYLSAIPDQHR